MEEYRITRGPASMYYIPNFLSAEEEASILQKIPSNRWITLSHRRLQAIPAPLTPQNALIAAPLPAWLARPAVERIHALGVFAGAPHAGINHCLVNEYRPGQGIMAHEDGSAYHPVVATVSLGGTVVLEVRGKREEGGDGNGEDGGDAEDGIGSGTTAGAPTTTATMMTTTTTTTTTTTRVEKWRIVQEPRSLLVTVNPAYERTLHGIDDVEIDEDLCADTVANWELLGDPERLVTAGGRNVRQTRISLTFRDVKKALNVGGKLFGKPRG